MIENVFISLFIVGFLGGVHCVGMCGGIVTALSLHKDDSKKQMLQHIVYNIGRILSYVVMGAIVGSIGQLGLIVAGKSLAPFHTLFANIMLIALGFYMLGITKFLAPIENGGKVIWNKIQPIFKGLIPAKTIKQGFLVGFLWGWLPCGLVYSALATALSTGSILGGMYAMLGFGLGTLPNLLLAGFMAVKFKGFVQQKAIRVTGGLFILLLGLSGSFMALSKIFMNMK